MTSLCANAIAIAIHRIQRDVFTGCLSVPFFFVVLILAFTIVVHAHVQEEAPVILILEDGRTRAFMLYTNVCFILLLCGSIKNKNKKRKNS